MNVNDYLHRIGYAGSRKADIETLRKLMKAHLRHVPFENLSIPIGERIKLDYAWLYEKIVVRNRGGFCYELNGLFSWLLRELGYRVDLLSAGVRPNGPDLEAFGPAFDHMVLKVDLDESWLVDVGFGRAFSAPLALRPDEIQVQGPESFRLTRDGDSWIYWRLDTEWQADYRFTLTPYSLEAFENMCRHHQTSNQSPFTKRWIVTRLSPKGRETLHQDGEDFRYISTTGTVRREVIIQGFENAAILLEEIFAISADIFDRPGRRKNR